jgi:hypothetical protein
MTLAPRHSGRKSAPEIAELEALQEGLDERNGQRRARAELGLGLSDDPELRLLQRYQAQHRRTFQHAQPELRHCYDPPGTVVPPDPTARLDAKSPAASVLVRSRSD